MQIPKDHGGVYAETNLENLFPEPFNAVTSLFFLGVAIWWTLQIKGRWREFPFLTYALALLYVGGIGGSLYHGLRIWPVFLIMDWLPIMLLCLSAGLWFLAKLTRWYFAVLIVLGYFALQQFLRMHFADDIQRFINTNYALLGAIVLLPVLGFLIATRFKHAFWVGLALFAFVLALFFRVADKWELLPMGTHFLWHVFGAVAAFSMLQFVYLTEQKPKLAVG
ncbi:hypothetical protein [Flavobacterium caeni]|uniref:Hemolysin III n=1 Tax=Flavobacterium caeni TaxID=490189 RepID=A0A1G5JXA6_9FLAO|nr:hypothetical protein [Flavobacterium caeni]SCY92947.1 hemolysin III [Flavobacterium caeni]